MELPVQITHDGFRLPLSEEELQSLADEERKLAENLMQKPWMTLFQQALADSAGSLQAENPALSFLKETAEGFVSDLLRQPGLEEKREQITVEPDEERMQSILENRPLLRESALIDEAWVWAFYSSMNEAFQKEIAAYPGSVKKFFNEFNPALNPPESIFFHLVENKEGDYPFAFLATYARENPDGRISHIPLNVILAEYRNDTSKMLELLSCLNQAADLSPLISSFMVSGELFHPLGLTSAEAYEFLKKVPDLEKAGIVCRIPNWWRKRTRSLSLSLKLGDKKPSLLGLDSLISVKPELSVDGHKLTQAEINKILSSTEGLVLIKGNWVEADPAKLQTLLSAMKNIPDEMSFAEAMQIQSGLLDEEQPEMDSSVRVSQGKWMNSVFSKLSNPSLIRKTALPKGLQATLRPYQMDGYNWLNSLSSLGFGALLADDMGLGKTVQTLAWLEKEHQKNPQAKALLVVPASLLNNWQKEARQFTPDLSVGILHGKAAFGKYREILEKAEAASLESAQPVCDSDLSAVKDELPFLTITTYGSVSRNPDIAKHNWDFLVLDEAQAIKNPLTRQSTAIKEIPAARKLAMTGTPIENDLVNLWSIFDFLNPGLLGDMKHFKEFAHKSGENPRLLHKLQTVISPFLLRRMKSDKSVIADLPDKIEQNDYIALSKEQTVLYNQVVAELQAKLEKKENEEGADGRSGLVLSTLSKLKQICNHPDQYLGQKGYAEKQSGKFEMLKAVCEPIAENRECVLVFTQFREMTDALDKELEKIFHAKGFVIHGGTPAKKRQEIVDAFNEQKTYIPYVVLSLRAAGTGLNLTQASHVVHFDRWWNPAVENQATDRAYRIGQKKNVMVHKFVCENTIEEKIDEMISNKQQLADTIVKSSAESWLTTLSDDDLIKTLRMKL